MALGWLLLAFVVQRASTIEGEGLTYDPFKILGISTVRVVLRGRQERGADGRPSTECYGEGDQEALQEDVAQVVRSRRQLRREKELTRSARP